MKLIKQHLAAFLILVVLTPVIYQVSTLSYFYANQAVIINKHCVNKSKPKLQCNAKCYLSKKLEQPGSDQVPMQIKLLESTFFVGILNVIDQGGQADHLSGSNSFIEYQTAYSFLYVSKVFQPPRLV